MPSLQAGSSSVTAWSLFKSDSTSEADDLLLCCYRWGKENCEKYPSLIPLKLSEVHVWKLWMFSLHLPLFMWRFHISLCRDVILKFPAFFVSCVCWPPHFWMFLPVPCFRFSPYMSNPASLHVSSMFIHLISFLSVFFSLWFCVVSSSSMWLTCRIFIWLASLDLVLLDLTFVGVCRRVAANICFSTIYLFSSSICGSLSLNCGLKLTIAPDNNMTVCLSFSAFSYLPQADANKLVKLKLGLKHLKLGLVCKINTPCLFVHLLKNHLPQ